MTSSRWELENGRRLRLADSGRYRLVCLSRTHDGVDAADNRRYLLERHLHGRWEAREGDVEELASFGLAYLARLPDDEC